MLTVYYLAATWLQSRKLSTILQKLSSAHKSHASVVLHQELPPYLSAIKGEPRKLIVTSVLSDYCSNYKDGQIADLLLYNHSKRMVSIYPKQNLDISGWVKVLPGRTHIPIQINRKSDKLNEKDKILVLLEANYNTCKFNYSSKIFEVEDIGNPIAWFVRDRLCILIETNEFKLAFLSLLFMEHNITLENGIEIMRIESVDTSGTPYEIENTRSIPETYAQLDPDLNQEELNKSFMDRWRAHVSMLCTFCDAISQVKILQQDISVRHPGSGVGAVKLVPGGMKNVSTSPKPPEEPESGECSSMTSTTVESPTISTSNTEMSTAQGSTRLAADSTATSMSSLRSLPTTPRRTLGATPEKSVVKPPNVVILSDSSSSAEAVKSALEHCLIRDRYTIHIVNYSDIAVLSLEHACVVVIHGNVPSDFRRHLINYLLENSGSLLCLCSDFIGSILPMFDTTEVRPNELVSCSYKGWKHVPLIHHVFCYQPTPSKPQFSHDDPSPRGIPDSVEITGTDGKVHALKIDILGAEETWQTPSLLLVSLINSTSKIVFSQVHLEIDPAQYEADDKKRQALENSNKARLEIFSDVLVNHLDLKCSSTNKGIQYTNGYFLGNHEIKQDLLDKLRKNNKLDNNVLLTNNDLTLKFCGKGVSGGQATSTHLPILVHSCPESFSTVAYFENLKTEKLGRLVIFSEVMTSSMDLIENVEMVHGFTVIPYYQTKGKGRSGNMWLSPKGCALFSMQLHIPLNSNLGKHISLLQHIASLAIVSSICELPNLEELNIGLKWPNDIYANGTSKIGGVMATSTIYNNVAVCNIGCGLNLKNKEPTVRVCDMIAKLAQEKKIKIKDLSFEHYFSNVFNKLEHLIDSINSGDLDTFYTQYYTYWLHSDAEVTVRLPKKPQQTVRIKGIDEYGFLTVETPSGQMFTVQPDGNSFDMMAGLIVPKI